MWKAALIVLRDATRDLRETWRDLAYADLVWKAGAFLLLTPGTLLLIRWLVLRNSSGVVADAQIAMALVTTGPGILAVLLGSVLLTGVTVLETACLMAIGMARTEGRRLDPRHSLLFAIARAPRVLALTGHMITRLLAGLVPFALAGGVVYLLFLRSYDINYYLSKKPPSFWAAAGIVAILGVTLTVLLARTIVRWSLSLPLVLFEDVHPRRALGESRQRSAGHRGVILAALVLWGASSVVLASVALSLPEALGRMLAPQFSGSLAAIVLFLTGLAFLNGILVLAVGIFNVSLFSLVLARLFLSVGEPRQLHVPSQNDVEASEERLRARRRMLVVAAVVAGLGLIGMLFLRLTPARTVRPVEVIAHRGASLAAPENTLAAFRLALDQGADYVELDVQESKDGDVLVVHDSDLMKLGGGPAKIWDATTAELRSVDIGSRVGPQFAGERVPTLAEALALCKGRSRVIVELKSYGHDVRLEEKVVGIVEAAGMAGECAFMSLDHGMVRKMKQLRPNWRTGVLAAKAIGDLSTTGADFVAVESKMATHRFVRRAHNARQDVYVWTVDDPAWMLAMMSRGVDGLITNTPDVARAAVRRREAMSEEERVLVALMVRLGADTKVLEAGDSSRP
jgi:glycerophosphoryl diester phosphodiesterase